jgi:hypothetical protein
VSLLIGSVGCELITLRGGCMSVSCGHTLRGCEAVAVWKMVVSWCRAASHSSPNFANGVMGAGLCSASMRLMADLMMVSMDERHGMGHCL